jgi:hypothetical protein
VVGVGREGEVVGAGMVVVVMAPQPETPPLPPVLVLVLVLLSVVVGVLGACACVRARELACARRAYASGRHALCPYRVHMGRVGGWDKALTAICSRTLWVCKQGKGRWLGLRPAPVGDGRPGRGVGRLGAAGGAGTEVPGHLWGRLKLQIHRCEQPLQKQGMGGVCEPRTRDWHQTKALGHR